MRDRSLDFLSVEQLGPPEDETGQYVHPHAAVAATDQFTTTEVGITHPDNPSFIKIHGSGDIEISAGPGCAVILSGTHSRITIVAEDVKMFTSSGDNIFWNRKQFNYRATTFTEPALTTTIFRDRHSVYQNADLFTQ